MAALASSKLDEVLAWLKHGREAGSVVGAAVAHVAAAMRVATAAAVAAGGAQQHFEGVVHLNLRRE